MTPFDNFRRFREFIDRDDDNLTRRRFWNLFDTDPFQEFEDMQREIHVMLDQFDKFARGTLKELISDYEARDESKMRESNSFVYGYFLTFGSNVKPTITEFRKVDPKYLHAGRGGVGKKNIEPRVSVEREPLVDINSTDKEIKVVLEILGVDKNNIKITAYKEKVEIATNDCQRKYNMTLNLPEEADIDTAKATYNNGILEMTFNKKGAGNIGKKIEVD